MRLRQAGRQSVPIVSVTATEITPPVSFDDVGLSYAHMLLLPDRHAKDTDPVRIVGSDCRVCPVEGCLARREPSILA